MVGYVNCPYCNEETMVSFEEHNSGEDIEDTCEHCDKDFIYQFESSVDFTTQKKEMKMTEEIVTPDEMYLNNIHLFDEVEEGEEDE